MHFLVFAVFLHFSPRVSARNSKECISRIHATFAVTFLTTNSAGHHVNFVVSTLGEQVWPRFATVENRKGKENAPRPPNPVLCPGGASFPPGELHPSPPGSTPTHSLLCLLPHVTAL